MQCINLSSGSDTVFNVCTDCGLYIVGSSLNGFGSSLSDMDLCLMVSHLEVFSSSCVYIHENKFRTKTAKLLFVVFYLYNSNPM